MKLSNSTVELLEKCPRSYQLQKIQKVQQAPAPALIVGNAVHYGCETDNVAVLQGRGHLSYAVVLEAGMHFLDDAIATLDPTGLLNHSAMARQVTATLATYCAQVAPNIYPVAVEESFLLPITSGVEFSGRIDLITENHGLRTIVDFKTASRPWAHGLEHTKLQATAYLLGAAYLGKPAQRVTFITFPMQADGSAGLDIRPTYRKEDDLIEYQCKVAESAARIQVMTEHDWFPARPTPLCAWCGVLGHCPTGRAWLQQEGRDPAVPVLEPVEVAS
jgi:RecB family exonuclease